METFSITRTSNSSAECEPIVLRMTDQRRLVFKAMLLDNPHDQEACVDGSFVYQRKRKADEWEDHNELKLTELRAEEWIRLKLSAEEVHTFLRHMAALYRHHDRYGLPRQKIHLLKVHLDDDDAAEIQRLDFRRVLRLSHKAGFDVVADFIEWVARLDNSQDVLRKLAMLDVSSLERLGDLARLQGFHKILEEWEERLGSGDEEYWQKDLEKYVFVLAQVVAFPVLVIQGKAFVGGKGLHNVGGQVADYLAQNPITRNAVIVELKTPTTELLEGRQYRNGIYAPSGELSGAVSQVLGYRQTLTQKYDSLKEESPGDFTVFRPPCLVVAGHVKRELKSLAQVRSFELYRSELKDVMIVTFDELVGKLRQLINALRVDVGRGG